MSVLSPRHLIISSLLFVNIHVYGQGTLLPATGPQPTILDEAGKPLNLYKASYALLISQRNYLGISRRGWRPLEATSREMDEVATALRRHGFNVVRANDLTGSQLTTVFRDFMAEYGYEPNNRLLFFFSGHGYTNPQNDMGYIVPVDALDPNIQPGGFFSKALPIDTIQTWARELTARHVLFMFDSCFSGSIFVSRSAATAPEVRPGTASERLAYFRGSSSKPVRQFIAAGGPKEELPSTSVFVPLLLEGLDGGAARSKDGYVTGKELGMWIEQVLPTYRASQNPHSGVIRQPEFSFGDMLFQVPPRGVQVQTWPTQPAPVPAAQVQAATIAPTTTSLPTPPSTSQSRSVREKVTFAADAFFDSGKTSLRPEGQDKARKIVAAAQDVNLDVIIIEGHADTSEGSTTAYRTRLSEQRAMEMKEFLTLLGVDPFRIYTEGKGDAKLVGDNRTIEGRAKNRRIEIEFVGTRYVQR